MPRGRGSLPLDKQPAYQVWVMMFWMPLIPALILADSFVFTPRHPPPEWVVWIGRVWFVGIVLVAIHFFSRPRWRELRRRRETLR